MIKLPSGIIRNVDLDKKEKNEDERRLFYVALTRAKKEIQISYSDIDQSGSDKKENFPSMFISEIDKKYIKTVDTDEFEKNIKINLETNFNEKSEKLQLEDEEDFLNSLVNNFKMNITSLNTYINCPYKFKLNSVLRTPSAKPTYAAFGTAVHKALELFYKKFIKEKALPSLEFLYESLQIGLDNEILTESEKEQLIKKGQIILKFFYENHDFNSEPIFIEYKFGFRNVYLDDIKLSGNIDRIDWLDKDAREAKVIDYKTGKVKSRNAIEGKTKDKNEDMIRQLYFYKILTLCDHNFFPVAKEGEFIFLDNKASAKNRIVNFEFEKDKIDEMKKLIKTTVSKIRSLQFERTKEYEHCKKCPYQFHCWPEGIPPKQ